MSESLRRALQSKTLLLCLNYRQSTIVLSAFCARSYLSLCAQLCVVMICIAAGCLGFCANSLAALQGAVTLLLQIPAGLGSTPSMRPFVLGRNVLFFCTLGSLLAVARHFTPSREPGKLKAIVNVHLQNSRKPLSVMELSDFRPAPAITQQKLCAR